MCARRGKLPTVARAASELNHFALWRVLGWLLVLFVILVSLLPVPQQMQETGISDKWAHTVAYFGLTFWFGQLYAGRALAVYALGFAVMGIVLELLQGFTGYRSLELLDMAANTAGVLLGLLLIWLGLTGVFRIVEAMLFGKQNRLAD